MSGTTTQRGQATFNENLATASQEPQTGEKSLDDIESEKQKFLQEKQSWENEKKRLQEQLKHERRAREVEREKEAMARERREWELERNRMQEELDANNVSSSAEDYDDEAVGQQLSSPEEIDEMTEEEKQFRVELAEKLPSVGEGWDDMDADQKWQAIKGLELFEEAFMKEVEGAFKDVSDKNLEPEAEQEERNALMDNLLQELDELAFPPDPMDSYREEWDRLLEETTEPHKRETMYKAFEQCEDDQKYNMLLEWSSYLRRPENPYYAMTQGLDTSNANNSSSSNDDMLPSKEKDSMSEALKYGLLFFVVLIVIFILFLVLFPEMWKSLTDTFSDEI